MEQGQQSPPDGYTEKHHILPRCLGGTNHPSNLVRLSARQHFVAHRLLWKMYPNTPSLFFAFRMMFFASSDHSRDNQTKVRSRLYGRIKEDFATHMRQMKLGVPLPEATKQKIRATLMGRAIPEEVKEKIRAATIGRQASETARQKISESLRGVGKPLEWRETISARFSKRWEIITPTGERLVVTNLNQFCKKHGIHQSNISLHGHTKGYSARIIPKPGER